MGNVLPPDMNLWESVEVIGDDDAPKYLDFNKQYFKSKKDNEPNPHKTSINFPKGFWAEFSAWFARQSVYPNYGDFIRDWCYKGFAFVTSHDGSEEAEQAIKNRLLVIQADNVRSQMEGQQKALEQFKDGIMYAKENGQVKMLGRIKEDLQEFVKGQEGSIKERAEQLLKMI